MTVSGPLPMETVTGVAEVPIVFEDRVRGETEVAIRCDAPDDEVLLAAHHAERGEVTGLKPRSAEAVQRDARDGVRPTKR